MTAQSDQDHTSPPQPAPTLSDSSTPPDQTVPSGETSPPRHLLAHFDFWLLAAVLLGTLVRAWDFGAFPPGLHQDEASAGYDAFALLNYGIDRNGFHNPVACVAWGSGMFALVVYLAMPAIALFGLNAWAVRLPCLLVGVGSLVVFAWLMTKLRDRPTARIATFLLAICPWHVVVSRWALDSNLLPGVLLLAVAATVLAVDRPRFLPLAFALCAVSLYAYGTAYIVVPVYLVLATTYGIYHRRWSMGQVAIALLTFTIVAAPAVLYVVINVREADSIVTPWLSIPRLPGLPRYETVGNFHFWEPAFYIRAMRGVAEALLLLVIQTDFQIWNGVPWYAFLYYFSLPFSVFGFGLLCRACWQREFTRDFFMLAWCLAAAAVVPFVLVSVNRVNAGLIPLVYCTSVGVGYFRQRRPPLFAALAALYALSFLAFTWSYFSTYADRVAREFNASLTETIAAASANPEDVVCVTDAVIFPYIFALFASQEDPHEFLQTVQYANPGEEFQDVSSFGRYKFGLPKSNDATIDVFVIRLRERKLFPRAYVMEPHGEFAVLRKASSVGDN